MPPGSARKPRHVPASERLLRPPAQFERGSLIRRMIAQGKARAKKLGGARSTTAQAQVEEVGAVVMAGHVERHALLGDAAEVEVGDQDLLPADDRSGQERPVRCDGAR